MADSEKPHVEKDIISYPSPRSEDEFDAIAGVNEKALLRKLDLKLLPALTSLYLLSFLDRSNGMTGPMFPNPGLGC